jgi:4'-phosphopantetheinyl transferase
MTSDVAEAHRVHPPTGPTDEIHVWRAPLDGSGWAPPDRLPLEERERAARLRPPGAARRWAAARWALRGVLAHYIEENPAEIALRTGSHGKPALADPTAALRFNLSHSSDLALVAVTQAREIGIDVEWIDPRRDVLSLAPNALDPAAAEAVRAASPAVRSAVFHAAWVRREAVVKCLGIGLGTPIPEAAVAIAEFDAGPGFVAALAIVGHEVPPLRHLTISAPKPMAVRRPNYEQEPARIISAFGNRKDPRLWTK